MEKFQLNLMFPSTWFQSLNCNFDSGYDWVVAIVKSSFDIFKVDSKFCLIDVSLLILRPSIGGGKSPLSPNEVFYSAARSLPVPLDSKTPFSHRYAPFPFYCWMISFNEHTSSTQICNTDGSMKDETYPSGWDEKNSRLAFIFKCWHLKREVMTSNLMENRKLKTFSRCFLKNLTEKNTQSTK